MLGPGGVGLGAPGQAPGTTGNSPRGGAAYYRTPLALASELYIDENGERIRGTPIPSRYIARRCVFLRRPTGTVSINVRGVPGPQGPGQPDRHRALGRRGGAVRSFRRCASLRSLSRSWPPRSHCFLLSTGRRCPGLSVCPDSSGRVSLVSREPGGAGASPRVGAIAQHLFESLIPWVGFSMLGVGMLFGSEVGCDVLVND